MNDLQINCRNTTLTPAIQEYIEKKLDFLQKFQKYIDKINIEITDNIAESLPLKYEVTIALKNGLVRVEERGTDLYSIIDVGHDRIKMKLEKFKDRYTDHTKEKSSQTQPEPLVDAISEEMDEEGTFVADMSYKPKIAKRKLYSDNRPLHPEEAITQMEMLGHASFLFKNIETNKYAMVYKRVDGDYGLVEPEHP